jgi:hypothetical protein
MWWGGVGQCFIVYARSGWQGNLLIKVTSSYTIHSLIWDFLATLKCQEQKPEVTIKTCTLNAYSICSSPPELFRFLTTVFLLEFIQHCTTHTGQILITVLPKGSVFHSILTHICFRVLLWISFQINVLIYITLFTCHHDKRRYLARNNI